MKRWLNGELGRVSIFEREIAIKRVHLTTLIVATLVALLVGFAGGLFTGSELWRPTSKQIAQSCPANNAQMGCVVKLYAQHNGVKAHDPAGPFFPDVYEGQGFPDWAAAKPHISGAIVKAFEYRQDNSFAYNASTLSRLGIRWGAYLFVRGCGYGPSFVATVRPWIVHISVLVLDMEVPAAGGCAPELYGSVHTAFPAVRIVIYSAPGTWPGGSSAGLDEWVAAYGPSAPPCLFTCLVGASHGQTILAWQLTDGTYGFRVYTPGIGYGDDSVDYGIFNQTPTAKPDPFAVFVNRAFAFGHDRANERRTARLWKTDRCRNPVRREVCKTTRRHLELLLGRINFLAFHRPIHDGWVWTSPPRWAAPNKQQPFGLRAALIRADLHHR